MTTRAERMEEALRLILSWHEFAPHDEWCVRIKGGDYCNCHRGRIVKTCRDALAETGGA